VIASGVGPSRGALLALLAGALVGCAKGPPGRKLASGIGRDLVLSPGGELVSFLTGAAHPEDRSIPEDLVLGDLWIARASEGGAEKIGSSVPNLRSARAYDPSGASLAFLASYRFRDGDGELRVADAAGGVRKIAETVSSFAWAPPAGAGKREARPLAFVSGGQLRTVDLSQKSAPPALVQDGVQTFAWAPAGTRLATRASGSSGGRVEIFDVATGRTREAAKESSDLSFGPDGTLYVLGPAKPKGGDRPLIALQSFDAETREIGRATSIAVSPQGDLALLSTDKNPGEAYGTLLRRTRGGPPQPVGERVSEFRFTPRGDLVFLARYDLRARAGTLTAAAPGAGPREIAPKVQSFSIAGDRVLYVAQHPEKGDFRIELWTADLASGSPPHKIDDGVYGYELARDGISLFYKARCAGGPRSCSLFRGAVDRVSPAQLLAAGVAGFELSPDGKRLLLELPHRGAARAVDLAALASSASAPAVPLAPFVEMVDPSALLAGADGRRVVYAALDPARAGVYVAELP
jgi:hypothetical protein